MTTTTTVLSVRWSFGAVDRSLPIHLMVHPLQGQAGFGCEAAIAVRLHLILVTEVVWCSVDWNEISGFFGVLCTVVDTL